MISLDKDEPLLEETQQDLRDIEEMLETRGWQKLMSVAEAQRKSREGIVYQPVLREEIFKQEFMKGEMAGIKLFQQLPYDLVDDLTEVVQQLKEEVVNEQND